jgi:hypothetical protein
LPVVAARSIGAYLGVCFIIRAACLVCKPCAKTRLIGADDLPPGTAIGTGVTLIDPAADSQVFTF